MIQYQHRGVGRGAGKSYNDKKGCIQPLPNQRRTDGARPKPAAPGGQFHTGHDERIGEFTQQISRKRCQKEPWRIPENGLVGRLPSPKRSRGQEPADPGENDEYKVTSKAQPDYALRPAKAVDLGKDVAKDVAQREYYHCGRHNDPAETNDFNGDDIGCDEAGYENGRNNKESICAFHSFNPADAMQYSTPTGVGNEIRVDMGKAGL